VLVCASGLRPGPHRPRVSWLRSPRHGSAARGIEKAQGLLVVHRLGTGWGRTEPKALTGRSADRRHLGCSGSRLSSRGVGGGGPKGAAPRFRGARWACSTSGHSKPNAQNGDATPVVVTSESRDKRCPGRSGWGEALGASDRVERCRASRAFEPSKPTPDPWNLGWLSGATRGSSRPRKGEWRAKLRTGATRGAVYGVRVIRWSCSRIVVVAEVGRRRPAPNLLR
jgi:hypothetical protein